MFLHNIVLLAMWLISVLGGEKGLSLAGFSVNSSFILPLLTMGCVGYLARLSTSKVFLKIISRVGGIV